MLATHFFFICDIPTFDIRAEVSMGKGAKAQLPPGGVEERCGPVLYELRAQTMGVRVGHRRRIGEFNRKKRW